MPGLLNRMRERGYGQPMGQGMPQQPQGGAFGGPSMQQPPMGPPGMPQMHGQGGPGGPQSLLPRFTNPGVTPDTPAEPWQGLPSMAERAGITEGHPSLYNAAMTGKWDGFKNGMLLSTLTPGGMIDARGGKFTARNMMDPLGIFS